MLIKLNLCCVASQLYISFIGEVLILRNQFVQKEAEECQPKKGDGNFLKHVLLFIFIDLLFFQIFLQPIQYISIHFFVSDWVCRHMSGNGENDKL